MAKFKPAFTVSEKKILWNLHVAAAEKLKKKFPKVKVSPLDMPVESINNAAPTSADFEIKALINTAFGYEEDDSLKNKDGKYKVYAIYMLKNITSKPATDKIKKEILKVLDLYFTVFCGSSLASKIKEDSIEDISTQDDDTSDINRQVHALKSSKNLEAMQVEYTIGSKVKANS